MKYLASFKDPNNPRCKSITTPKFRFCDIYGLPLANIEINPEIDHNAVMKEMSSILAKYPDVLPEVLAKAQRC